MANLIWELLVLENWRLIKNAKSIGEIGEIVGLNWEYFKSDMRGI